MSLMITSHNLFIYFPLHLHPFPHSYQYYQGRRSYQALRSRLPPSKWRRCFYGPLRINLRHRSFPTLAAFPQDSAIFLWSRPSTPLSGTRKSSDRGAHLDVCMLCSCPRKKKSALPRRLSCISRTWVWRVGPEQPA